MTHYYVSFRGKNDPDRAALIETIRYIGGYRFRRIARLKDAESINFAMGFCGVSGYPYHAMCRRYALESYREWMHSEPDPVLTDERGFQL